MREGGPLPKESCGRAGASGRRASRIRLSSTTTPVLATPPRHRRAPGERYDAVFVPECAISESRMSTRTTVIAITYPMCPALVADAA
jgi:hypothetical protein